jgi:hypothetical protein
MPRADFSTIGSIAYPHRLSRAWSPFLVEPESVRVLRQQAASKLCELGTIAPVRSGMPTRAVRFFAVREIDPREEPDDLLSIGIRTQQDRRRLALVEDGRGVRHVIERESLRSVLRAPNMLNATAIVDEVVIGGWRLLYVHEDRPTLEEQRRAHTLAYLEYGERTDFRGPSGGRRVGGIPSERAQVAVRPVWWFLPRIDESEGRIAFPIGRGDRHYVASLPPGVLIMNNFLYATPPEDLAHPLLLAAIANTSWTHLMCEVFGRRTGGDGVLHTYVRELNQLPIPDPYQFSVSEAEELVGLFRVACSRPSLPTSAELREPDRQAFDRFAMRHLFGIEETESALVAVERALRDLEAERHLKAASGRVQQQRAVRRGEFDATGIAALVVRDLPALPSVQAMVGEEIDTLGVRTVVIPDHQPGSVSVGASLFDSNDVLINGSHLLTTETVTEAYLIEAMLRVDIRADGPVVIPADADEVVRVLASWQEQFADWRAQCNDLILTLIPQSRLFQRRRQVRAQIERLLDLSPGLLGDE